MLTTSQYERKIKSFGDIGDIVNAMKAFAGVAVRKTEELVDNIRQYERILLQGLSDLMAHYPGLAVEKSREGGRVLLVLGSAQGLCGAYNDRVADALADNAGENDAILVVGRKLRSILSSRGIRFDIFREAPVSVSGIDDALGMALAEIAGIYVNKGYYNLTALFTVVQEKRASTVAEEILPPDIERARKIEPSKTRPMIYLEPKELFDRTLEEFLYISLFRCYIEALRSENWYRLNSLDSASENIERKISELRSLQNYARQEEITEELIEILGGGKFFGRK